VKRPEGFDPGPGTPKGEPGKTGKPSGSGKPSAPKTRQAKPAPVRDLRASKANSTPPERASREPRTSTRSQRRAERAEARRFTRGSRRRRVAWLSVLGIVAVLAAVLLVAVFSPILALRTIEVDGVSAIPASTIQDALKGQLGTPLALLNDNTIRSRLSHIILIRSYVTEVVPPNTLVVRVVEREAIAVLPDGDHYDQVDPAGVVLRTSPTAAGLPVIDIGQAGVNSAGFASAVKVLLAMPSTVLDQVKSISATTLDNVSLTLDSGTHTVLWGSAAQSDLKAKALTTLLVTCAKQQVLNVTAPLALACGPAQPTATPTPTAPPTHTPTP
jgi:cell division protein FtsQ